MGCECFSLIRKRHKSTDLDLGVDFLVHKGAEDWRLVGHGASPINLRDSRGELDKLKN